MTYQHDNADRNLSGLQNAMRYDDDGEPSLRVSIENVEVNSGLSNTVYNPFGNLNAGVDAFGRLRVSNPVTLFDATNVNVISNKFFNYTNGSASVSHTNSRSSADIAVSGVGIAYRQSKRRMSYQPGKSFLVLNTFVMDTPQSGLTQVVGLWDTSNGITFSSEDEDLVMSIRNEGVVNKVMQSDWNVDKLDGTGPSGLILDVTKSQILFIDVEWLGVGSVRTGFVINGQYVIAHIFHNANINDAVYTRTVNLPIRFQIESNGPSATMQTICSSVISESGYEARAIGKVDGTASLSGVSVGTDWVNLATIRLGNTNAIVVPAGIDILNISNTDFEWGLFVDATPSSAFTFNPSSSNVDIATNTVTFSSLGERIYGGYMGGKTSPATIGNGQLSWDNQLGAKNATTQQTLTLAIRSATSSKNAAGLLKWFEI
jgi:hypothetical protein